MKYFLLFFMILGMINFGFANETVEEITIKAELNLQVKSSKPLLDLHFDKTKIFQKIVDTNGQMLRLSPESLLDIKSALPKIIKSKDTIRPYLSDIVGEPVLRFRIKSKDTFVVKKWKILITDSQGSLFSTIAGKKDFPSLIEWNGSSDSGTMLVPGQWYSYNIDVIDEFGEKFTIPGETFNFKGLVHDRGPDKIISLSLSAIFDVSSDSLGITKQGDLLLKEAVDILKQYHDCPIKVVVYNGQEDMAYKRGEKILDFIKKNMTIDDTALDMEGFPSYVSENRVDIEIFIKK
ncbi:hypothetical protein ACFL5N_01405 [bacterium]